MEIVKSGLERAWDVRRDFFVDVSGGRHTAGPTLRWCVWDARWLCQGRVRLTQELSCPVSGCYGKHRRGATDLRLHGLCVCVQRSNEAR